MTVRELINELLECKMDAEVTVLVEIHKDAIQKTVDKYGDYSYPIDDDIDIKAVDNLGDSGARICLKELKP